MKSPMDNMAEATRLTRAGRLVEAMALLRGDVVDTVITQAEPTPANDADIVDLQPPRHPGDAWSVADSNSSADRRAPKSGKREAPNTARPAKPRVSIDSLANRLRYPQVTAPVSEGARFESRRHSGADGARDYKVYVPSSYRGQPLPLVVMLHGCTQSADDFAVGTRMNEIAEEQGVLVAYPEQSSGANSSRCWNWFNTANQQRDSGEAALIAGITREVMTEFAVDPARIYAAGLSAGGSAAATQAATYPDLYAAVGVHSGLAHAAATDMPSAFAAMRQGAAGATSTVGQRRAVPVIVFHGDADSTVHPDNGEQVLAQGAAGRSLQIGATESRSSGGVDYRRSEYRDGLGQVQMEHWLLQGVGHAWSGGNAAGSHTDTRGPNASREMLRFFLKHPMS